MSSFEPVNPESIQSPHRCGSVAVVGRPNVGKSTLVNALVGAKVSIVSNRPQTTRHRLLGIATVEGGQLLLVDTPGLHRGEGRFKASAMSRVMNRAARGALEDVDAALMVVEAGRWDEEDSLVFKVLSDAGIPVVLAVNKVDRLKDKSALLPFLAQVAQGRDFAAIHPVSALKRKGLEAMVRDLLARVPEAPPVYAEDEITDRSQRFLAGELVREQLMRQLGDELLLRLTREHMLLDQRAVPVRDRAAGRRRATQCRQQPQGDHRVTLHRQSRTSPCAMHTALSVTSPWPPHSWFWA